MSISLPLFSFIFSPLFPPPLLPLPLLLLSSLFPFSLFLSSSSPPFSPPLLPLPLRLPPLRSRMQFMLDTLKALRTNNIHRIPNYDPSLLEHSKKLLKRFIRSTGTLSSFPSFPSLSVLLPFLLFPFSLPFLLNCNRGL